jgi:predicted DNA-binding protein
VSPSRGTPRWSLRLPPDLKRRVQAKAARTGTTMTAVVVAALEAYVTEE